MVSAGTGNTPSRRKTLEFFQKNFASDSAAWPAPDRARVSTAFAKQPATAASFDVRHVLVFTEETAILKGSGRASTAARTVSAVSARTRFASGALREVPVDRSSASRSTFSSNGTVERTLPRRMRSRQRLRAIEKSQVENFAPGRNFFGTNKPARRFLARDRAHRLRCAATDTGTLATVPAICPSKHRAHGRRRLAGATSIRRRGRAAWRYVNAPPRTCPLDRLRRVAA